MALRRRLEYVLGISYNRCPGAAPAAVDLCTGTDGTANESAKNRLLSLDAALLTWVKNGNTLVQAKCNGAVFRIKAVRFSPKLLLVAENERETIEREPNYFIFPANINHRDVHTLIAASQVDGSDD